MTFTRRDFVGSSAVTAAALAGLPKTLFASVPADVRPVVESDEWDLTWPAKLNGKYSAVFDCAEPESGYGVWRASAWARQNLSVLKAASAEVTPAIVLRHNAIILAM